MAISRDWGRRPRLANFSHAEMQQFRRDFPFRVAWNDYPVLNKSGTNAARKDIHAFFRKINSPVVTTTNAIYLSTQTDVTLLLLGLHGR